MKKQSAKNTGIIPTLMQAKIPAQIPAIKRIIVPALLVSLLIVALFLQSCTINKTDGDDMYKLWLKYEKVDNPALLNEYRQLISYVSVQGNSETMDIIREELNRALSLLLKRKVRVTDSIAGDGTLIIGTPETSPVIKSLNISAELDTLGWEGYIIRAAEIGGKKAIIIAAGRENGLIYGTFHLLKLMQTQNSLKDINIAEKPRIQRRLLNHWDNLDRTAERGYAGKSLWKWDELPERIDPRYRDYARACASIGINGTVVNNVNASPLILTREYLKKAEALADVFRPYGIKLYLSVNFASPLRPDSAEEGRSKGIGNLDTADPLDPRVREWWKEKVSEIYGCIPDFGGFLVKANSEGMPGPQDFGRTHADGANMLAEALNDYNGIVMWRAFVYEPDVDPDRAKRSYKEFVPLDGEFAPNVFVQAKNGPIDFQPREPVQPLFAAMPHTPLMLELQITQEYLGHSRHLVYLAPMWKEYLEFDTYARGSGSELAKIIDGTVQNYHMTGIAGVANTGEDANWCGHFFAQANWYAFGRLAWDHTLTAADIADEWIRMSVSDDDEVVDTIKSMMMGSWEACINYMTPLGLHHIMKEGYHYGPQPGHDKGRTDWTSVYYHRADSAGIGFDRSSSGSNATSQYRPPLREQFDDISTCPEKYLLWFHHVNWDRRLKSGMTLWEELCHRYYKGVDYVSHMAVKWESLKGKIDNDIYLHVRDKLQVQLKDAAEWRDTCLGYFRKFSRKEIKI
jgi:alpha-glucuronidase